MAYHMCHYTSRGKLKCWGRNNLGQLGLGDTNNRGDESTEVLTSLPFVNVGDGAKVDQVSLGQYHSCVHLTSNQIKCWGSNDNGQLGLGLSGIRYGDTFTTTPNNLASVNLGTVSYPIQVVSGMYHTCVLFSNRQVKCFGSNTYGQVGLEGVYGSVGTSASQMGDDLPYLKLGKYAEVRYLYASAAASHSCVILSYSESMKCWGLNDNYQLGYGNTINRGLAANTTGDYLPAIDLGTESRAVEVGLGFGFTCALRYDDVLKCWGLNNYGQLGIGSTSSITTMGTALPSIPYETNGKQIKQIVGGTRHMCILFDDDANVKCVGRNDYGQLGQGDTVNRGDTPSSTLDKIPSINYIPGSNLRFIQSLSFATCLIYSQIYLRCFGYGGDGALGLGSTANIGSSPADMGSNLPLVNIFSLTIAPTKNPTTTPTTATPTKTPTAPTKSPTNPSLSPSKKPTRSPIPDPTQNPTIKSPTKNPTLKPTRLPSITPSTQSPTFKCSAVDKFYWESNSGKDNILTDLDVCSKTTTCGNILLQIGKDKEQDGKDCVEKCMKTNTDVKIKSYTDLCLSCIVDFATCQYSLCDVCRSGRSKDGCIECTKSSKCKNEFASCTGTLELVLKSGNETIPATTTDPTGTIVGSVIGVIGVIG